MINSNPHKRHSAVSYLDDLETKKASEKDIENFINFIVIDGISTIEKGYTHDDTQTGMDIIYLSSIESHMNKINI